VYSERDEVMWDLMRGGSHVSGAPTPRLTTICPHCGKSLLQAPKSSKCFIASATYSSDSDQVLVLRLFRDEFLARSAGGRAFIREYERSAQPIADLVRASTLAKAALKLMLAPVIGLCRVVLIYLGKDLKRKEN